MTGTTTNLTFQSEDEEEAEVKVEEGRCRYVSEKTSFGGSSDLTLASAKGKGRAPPLN